MKKFSRKPKEAAKLRDIILLTGFVIALLGYISKTVLIIGIIIMFLSLVPHFLWYRCPCCKKVLSKPNYKGGFCPHCGEKIE